MKKYINRNVVNIFTTSLPPRGLVVYKQYIFCYLLCEQWQLFIYCVNSGNFVTFIPPVKSGRLEHLMGNLLKC